MPEADTAAGRTSRSPGGARTRRCDNCGHVLLRARRRNGRFLVDRLPADPAEAETLRGDLLAVARRIPRRDHYFDTHTEMRCRPRTTSSCAGITVTNRSRTRRAIDLTSYAEVVLASPAADALHPAFGNLFVHREPPDGARRWASGPKSPPELQPGTQAEPWHYGLSHGPR